MSKEAEECLEAILQTLSAAYGSYIIPGASVKNECGKHIESFHKHQMEKVLEKGISDITQVIQLPPRHVPGSVYKIHERRGARKILDHLKQSIGE